MHEASTHLGRLATGGQMNKQDILAARGYFDMVHGVTVRVIGAFSDQDLDYRPKPEVRSIKELFFHIYQFEKGIAEALKTGRLTDESVKSDQPEADEGKALLASLKTVSQLQQFARECHQALSDTIAGLTDEELNRLIEAPFGSF